MAERKVTMKELLAGPAGEEYTLIVKMGRHKTLLVEGSAFAFDSAFPAAGIFLHLTGVQEELDAQSDARIMVFGHTDVQGSEDYNKKLSDKRAKAALAMIKRAVDMLDAVVANDDWGTQHYQTR
jgi:outer membrane protein OmpA-like peptidoglycan-associated protein